MPTTDHAAALATFRAALDALAAIDPTALYAERDAVIHRIQAATFPALVVVTVAAGLTDEHQALQCPHCGEYLSEYDDDSVRVVDVSERWTYAFAPDAETFERKAITVTYDDTADYQGLTYACGACEAPVALPEGWTEVTG